MSEKIPSKVEIFSVVQAQSGSVDELSKRLVKIEQLTERQDSRNRNVIITVIVASFLIFVTIAVQVSLSDKRDGERSDNLLEKVHEVKEKQMEFGIKQEDLSEEFNALKIRNSYLK